jgi:hypothetical protein
MKFHCENCDFYANKLCRWNEHILTQKHLKKTQQIETPSNKYYCEKCDVNCCHLSIFNRHKKTKNHVKKCSLTNKNAQTITIEKLIIENTELRNFIIEQSTTNSKTIETIIIQNNDTVNKAKDTVNKANDTVNKALDLCKSIYTNTTINQTNNQTNNQKFNINVFLNETCKDAINFSDFMKNIHISYEDLENNAQLGFVGGISKIFIDNLKRLGVNERPIHCTDVKRETMYIKDDNEWTKQTDDSKLQKAIQTISHRSLGKLTEWKQENPDYKDCNSDFSNKCVVIQRSIIAGYERSVYYPKVIHALARECMTATTRTTHA